MSPASIARLSPQERLTLIAELWDSLGDEDDLPLTPEQQAELERRMAALEDERGDAADWSGLRDELFGGLSEAAGHFGSAASQTLCCGSPLWIETSARLRRFLCAQGRQMSAKPDDTNIPRGEADADAPLSDDEFERGHGAMLARRARAATGLSQAAFAARYGSPPGSLRDWEQGRRAPDARR